MKRIQGFTFWKNSKICLKRDNEHEIFFSLQNHYIYRKSHKKRLKNTHIKINWSFLSEVIIEWIAARVLKRRNLEPLCVDKQSYCSYLLWVIKRGPLGLKFSGVSKRLKAINLYAGALGKFCPIYSLCRVHYTLKSIFNAEESDHHATLIVAASTEMKEVSS